MAIIHRLFPQIFTHKKKQVLNGHWHKILYNPGIVNNKKDQLCQTTETIKAGSKTKVEIRIRNKDQKEHNKAWKAWKKEHQASPANNNATNKLSVANQAAKQVWANKLKDQAPI